MQQTPKILICDDDPVVHESLKLYIEAENFICTSAYDGEEGLAKINDEQPDLILLDWMMPKMDGLDVCREVRKTMSTPIILLTAKGEEIDRVLGLELGADDYIVKPFSPREVLARIKAVLRRVNETAQPKETNSKIIRYGSLEINLEQYSVRVDGKPIIFTPKEVEILHLLASHPGQVLGRDQILSLIWDYDYSGDPRTVDTHIKRIRQKIHVDGAPWGITTVYSVGYKFEVNE